MKRTINILIIVSITLLAACKNSSNKHSSNWTVEEREAFRIQCENQVLFDSDPICFTGFVFSEIDTIMVVEKDSLTIVDTLYIYPSIKRNNHDEQYQKYWGSPNSKFNVNHTYEFYLDSDKPYVLDNMEMIMWSQYSMVSEGWGCEMGNFTIDDDTFNHVGNIYFTKREFKYDK